MSTAKERVQEMEMLSQLPDDCTIEDIQYHLYVVEKLRRGLESADTEPTYTQEEMEAEFSGWLTE